MHQNIISKLKSLKEEIAKANNGGILQGLYWRVTAIVTKEMGSDNSYNSLLKQFTDIQYDAYVDKNKGKLIGLINLIFDEHEETPELFLKDTEQTDTTPKIKTLNNKVFIVHGHNELMKQSVARVVEKNGLEPIILHEQPNQGLTLIEKFLFNSNVGFAIILLSSDDIVYSKLSDEKTLKYRARQNVIFELGFFIAKLGRERVIALVENSTNFELPSDYHGVLYVPFDSNEKWKFELARELISNGYSVDINKIM